MPLHTTFVGVTMGPGYLGIAVFFVAMKTLVAGCEFLSKRFLNRAGDCVSEEETISLRCRRERAENASQKPCASTQRVDCTVEGVKMPSLSGI